MRFRICRTSDSCVNFNNNPPCKNAVIIEEQEPILDRIRDENNKWILCSTGKIRIKKHWEVDINTLEELLELQTEVFDPLIISSDGMREIEIYDSYRE